MRARGGGRIIHVTSISVKQPIAGLVLSNALRSAVTSLAKTLAVELAPDNILVNCVAPGYTRTDMTMAGRSEEQVRGIAEMLDSRSMIGRGVGEPEEIAAVIEFVASPESGFMTGQSLLADGGRTDYLTHV